jgi:hypothetical protein
MLIIAVDIGCFGGPNVGRLALALVHPGMGWRHVSTLPDDPGWRFGIMAFAFNGSGESVIVAILMHSAFNAANRFIPAFLGNVSTRQYPSEGLLIALSFLLVAAVLVAVTRGRLLCAPAAFNQ